MTSEGTFLELSNSQGGTQSSFEHLLQSGNIAFGLCDSTYQALV